MVGVNLGCFLVGPVWVCCGLGDNIPMVCFLVGPVLACPWIGAFLLERTIPLRGENTLCFSCTTAAYVLRSTVEVHVVGTHGTKQLGLRDMEHLGMAYTLVHMIESGLSTLAICSSRGTTSLW